MIYTTASAIARRLPGRLTVGGIGSPFGPGVVDDGLIEQIGLQVEARVNARLGTLYRLPLTGAQPAIASIVEKLILCELLSAYAVGDEQAVSTSQGVDRSYTGRMCSQGSEELDSVMSGVVPLPGESLIAAGDRSASFTSAGTRKPLADSSRDLGLIGF